MLAIVGAGFVGFLDDWIKVRNERNLGLNKRAKMLGLLVVSVGFAVLYRRLHQRVDEPRFTRFDRPGLELGNIGWTVLAILLILATTNAVNLTDGLDGLAAGSAIFVVRRVRGDRLLGLPPLRTSTSSRTRSTSPWWPPRCSAPAPGSSGGTPRRPRSSWATPARSRSAARLACLSLTTNTELLLPIIGGLFVVETLSVIIQVTSFRLFHRRVFRMAPIHHHFELGGWPETTVIVRFWILAGLCVALALGFFYADFIHIGVAD